MTKLYYREGKNIGAVAKRVAAIHGYIQRKLAHMRRIGVPCELYNGAACPTWRAQELKAQKS